MHKYIMHVLNRETMMQIEQVTLHTHPGYMPVMITENQRQSEPIFNKMPKCVDKSCQRLVHCTLKGRELVRREIHCCEG